MLNNKQSIAGYKYLLRYYVIIIFIYLNCEKVEETPMFKGKIKQTIQQNLRDFFIITGILGIGALIFYLSDIKCLFKYTVGIPCPGCGLTRAWLSFLKMEWEQAFKWHPLFWMVPIVIIRTAFIKGKVFKNKRTDIILVLLVALLAFGVYCMRMVALFPDQAPMDYNKQSLAYKWIISKTVE